ncbi:MAG: amino acid carrier protein [Phycisphaerales bacterium]|nr:sodium:alanine symporter family protein [Planctomycetota bacterium]MCH8507937.1 amino acid carrier protein [Phycisphaerales bacterium]
MEQINSFVNGLNDILFSMVTIYTLVITGIIYTIWSVFGQYRALTHGVKVVRGAYDDKDDPGAINHFQALSAALSATVGLGNIAGVAVAVALGGPGAVFWMWIIGILGMALKMTEVTQSMLCRDTTDPERPKGGPMFVVQKGFAEWGLKPIGTAIGGLFAVTVIISAITGGNMFQAWNVGDVTFTYFEVPQVVSGIILSVVVALVIIGGIKRIGAVAGKIVPLMCGLYMLAALVVLFANFTEIPSMFGLIFRSAFSTAEASGAFLGGTFGYAMVWGIKRALFSSEAGQGSSPIAHSAAKTDEPVREGVVAGLEPFIDTIVVCTLTALVILSSGAYNRDSEAGFGTEAEIRIVQATNSAGDPIENSWTLETDALPPMSPDARRIRRTAEGQSGWRNGETVFVVVRAELDSNTGRDLRRITGTVNRDQEAGEWLVSWNTLSSEIRPEFREAEDGSPDFGIYGDYAGASLTAYSFDRVIPGLGMILVTVAAWLFAVSTMISWSYYGEQAVQFLFGNLRQKTLDKVVFFYKLFYCACILLTTVLAMPLFTASDGSKRAVLSTDAELDMWTTLGLGVMLVVNIPIMLLFGHKAMRAYHDYFRRMESGGDDAHEIPPITDVVEGKDVK